MGLSRISCLKCWVLAGALSGALAWAALATSGVMVPALVVQALPGATLAGQGQLRFWGLQVYDARLWVGPQFDVQDFAAHPLALELTYRRAFSGAAIARRSIEEMQHQAPLEPAQAAAWEQALARVLPDVQPGDRLTGVYAPGQGMQLWQGSKPLGSVPDAELARLFFGIWLSPRTSEPALRSALLGQLRALQP